MNRIPVIAGPTASGKSAVALQLANHFDGEIVTADAMQVYRGMDIGTAKPTADEQALVPHHLIDLVEPNEPFSIADWLPLAEQTISDIASRGKTPIVVGGTGFYITALQRGLPTVPAADFRRQQPLWDIVEAGNLAALQAELRVSAPADADRAGNNPRRVVRAVEILRLTGRPPASFPYTKPRFLITPLVLQPSMEVLESRIHARTAAMFAAGLEQEVAALLERWGIDQLGTARQAIGYKELFGVFTGEHTAAEAKVEISLRTRQYAKRQLTWFKRMQDAQFFPGTGSEQFSALQQAFTQIFSR